MIPHRFKIQDWARWTTRPLSKVNMEHASQYGKDLELCELPNSSRSSYATIWVRCILWTCFWNQSFWKLPFADTKKSFKWASLDKEFNQEKWYLIVSKFRTEPVGPQDPRQRLRWNMLATTEKIWNYLDSQTCLTFNAILACCICLEMLLKPMILGLTLCWHQKWFKKESLDKEIRLTNTSWFQSSGLSPLDHKTPVKGWHGTC